MADLKNLEHRVKSVMEDPSAQQIARVYADSFLNAANATGVEQALEEFQSFLDDVLKPNPEFASLLLTAGTLGRDKKVHLIDRVLQGRGSGLFTNFLRVLARHDRLDLLPLILSECKLRQDVRMGRRPVSVRSAVPLTEDKLAQLRQRLAETLPFQPVLSLSVDPALLGGLVIQVGDTVYDNSLRTRMKQLRGRLRQRTLHEIQSGRDRFSHPEGD